MTFCYFVSHFIHLDMHRYHQKAIDLAQRACEIARYIYAAAAAAAAAKIEFAAGA